MKKLELGTQEQQWNKSRKGSGAINQTQCSLICQERCSVQVYHEPGRPRIGPFHINSTSSFQLHTTAERDT